MSHRREGKLLAAVGAGLLCLCLAFATQVPSQEPAKPKPPLPSEEPAQPKSPLPLGEGRGEGAPPQAGAPHILFPPERVVLLAGDFDVIGQGLEGTLRAGGETIPWEPFAPPWNVGHVSLYPGVQKIQVGPRQREVFVARKPDDPDKPAGWATFRVHPIDGQGIKRCAACHETQPQGVRTALGGAKPYKACFECHRPEQFDAIHSHPLDPLQHCHACHALHGSREKGLLKGPPKKLCAVCHET